MHTRLTRTSMAIAVSFSLVACAHSPDRADPGIAESESEPGHGQIEGAREVAEPQLHLVSIDADGAIGMTDLLDGTESEQGSVGPPTSVTSEGRYLFASTAAGVEIIDSGVWTWDHVDHFHFYRSSPRLLGTVPGDGGAVVSTSGNATSGGTGVFFPDTGRAVLLSNDALSRGEIEEMFRIPVAPHDGVVAPLADGALVTAPASAGVAAEVTFHDASGTPVEATTTRCPGAHGAITTRVGVVIGCSDGVVLATDEGESGVPAMEHIPYPEGTTAADAEPAGAERANAADESVAGDAGAGAASEFRNRKGRPTVASPAGESGFWLLDTRERSWQHVPTAQPLLQVSAADDDEDHVVALDREGRVRVYDGAAGTELAATEPLLADAVNDPAALSGVELTVDKDRAYINDPIAGLVHEIDYRGDARVARSVQTPTAPDFVAVTGR